MNADESGARGYHGRPVIKEPAWTWEVPWYLFGGGLAGASSILAAAARARGEDRLARAAALVAGPAAAANPLLLIADLGRPARFLNMLRVFRPTSAMSMGSWLLAAYTPLAVANFFAEVFGVLPRLRRVVEVAAAVLGSGMTTYTAVLVSDSVVPVWHEARSDLPGLFGAGATASAGAAAALLAPADDARAARWLAGGAALVEMATAERMKRRLGFVGEPYRQGVAGRFVKASTVLTAPGAVLTLAAGRNRRLGRLGATLVLAGAACERWAVYKAGFASARDPRYTIGPQRERVNARGDETGGRRSD